MIKVRVKEGYSHRVPDPKAKGKEGSDSLGPLAKAGDVIEVTEAELVSFGDKFEVMEPAGKK
jgi:hypothetical protein